jgi:hypothetical protein
MSDDPERLSIDSDSELERLLLRSGRAPAPSGSRQRALLAASAVLVTAGLSAGGAAAGTVAAKAGSVLSLKWLAVLGVAGLGAMTVAVALKGDLLSSAPARRAEGSVTTVTTAARPALAPTTPTTQPPVTDETSTVIASVSSGAPRPSAARVSEPVAEPTASAESSVHAELGTLEQARGALSAGDPARALSILDAYSTRYPRGSMGPEATVLRVEALVRAGDPSAAARVGNAFLAGNPHSPYAERIRSLLGASNP